MADPIAEALNVKPVQIQGIHLVTEDDGWMLMDRHLYWTRDGGQTWSSITPASIEPYAIKSASFRDTQHGWLLLSSEDQVNFFAIARTTDGGKTWETRVLSLFASGDVDANIAASYFYWLDTQTGWLVTRRAANSNFDTGALFKTTDGGKTWTRLAAPMGDPVYFVTRDFGWMAGGPAGDQLQRTVDGGSTWHSQSIPGWTKSESVQHKFFLPQFADDREGMLPVMVADNATTRIQFYRTRDSGETWNLETDLPFDPKSAPGMHLPLVVVNPRESLILLPGQNRALRTVDRQSMTLAGSDPWIAGIDELDMVSPSVGWAMHRAGNCSPNRTRNQASPAIKQAELCSAQTRLLRTNDGGASWQVLPLPKPDRATPGTNSTPSQPPAKANSPGSVSGPGTFTQIFIGQGFDKCEVADLNSLQEWWTNSPYKVVNLYIGGSARGCKNQALTADYVSQIAKQGWKLIPTWVGPQASCSGYSSRMSSDLMIAYNQGVSEANAALQVAANLQLTDGRQSGTVIYYDLEAYNTGDTGCRDAADSFISGWSGQLQAKGNIAGVYGASCGSAPSDWASITHVPDVLWVANWLIPYQYRSDATVWGASCLSDTLWKNDQRIRQYAGGHNETWGSVTLNIDSNVSDGIVAFPPWQVYAPLIER
jgi:photosystem II stability/assembly factor-like uncharacterized protein